MYFVTLLKHQFTSGRSIRVNRTEIWVYGITAIALIRPFFIEEEGGLFDNEDRRIATISEVSSPHDLQQLQPANDQAENVIINLLDWQVSVYLNAQEDLHLIEFINML